MRYGKMIDFRKKIKETTVQKRENPIEIYNSLDRTSSAGPLRGSQEMVLKKWYEEKEDDKDVIIKLHTGEGKTLIGLLILMTKMNKGMGPCVYVCPNKYLVDQVCKEATKFGIPICTIGENNDLPNEFQNQNRILITHVQKIFNGKTIFGTGNRSENIGTIILDDAHACLDAIRDAFVISIKRNKEEELYKEILELFEDDLSEQGEGTLWDIKNNDDYESIMEIPYWAWIDKKSQVLELLAKNEEKESITFVWPLIKNHLENCQAFINGGEIQIMPVVAPINMFGSFSNADHRVLMSATTQDDSFFVKALGISIKAIKDPIVNEDLKWSGEKMILIPSLIAPEFTRDAVLEYFCKRKYKFGVVALTPNWKKQDDYRNFECHLLDNSSISREIYDLQQGNITDGKVRVLTNRYDGIDLPDNACRILIIDSLPFFVNMRDKYEERARRNCRLIQQKIAQKIEQGLGRSVRSEKDYSCIILIGPELVSFIRSSATRELFSQQTQKQISIGLQVSEWAKEDGGSVTLVNLVELINQCLKRDAGWKDYYESEMNSIVIRDETRENELTILSLEQRAEMQYVQRKYDEAAKTIQQIIDGIHDDESERGWYLQIMAHFQYHLSKRESLRLQKSAFENNYELLKPKEGIVYKRMDNINLNRIQNIIRWIRRFDTYSDMMMEVDRICECLTFGVEADKFELAMNNLGEALGFTSQRPDKTIKKGPDNLWRTGNNHYIMIECKSEVSQGRKSIHKWEVGQMNNHCGWFVNEYSDAAVLRIMVIPTLNIAYDADFTHDVKILRKKGLKKMKSTLVNFFKEFRDYDLKNLEEKIIHECLKLHKLDAQDFLNDYVEEPKHESGV